VWCVVCLLGTRGPLPPGTHNTQYTLAISLAFGRRLTGSSDAAPHLASSYASYASPYPASPHAPTPTYPRCSLFAHPRCPLLLSLARYTLLHSLTNSLSLSLSLSLTHTHTHSLSRSLSLSLTRARALSRALSHARTHNQTQLHLFIEALYRWEIGNEQKGTITANFLVSEMSDKHQCESSISMRACAYARVGVRACVGGACAG
jgi:hypothetical protein